MPHTNDLDLNDRFEYIRCNLCGSDDFRNYYEQTDRRFKSTPRDQFKLVECNRCGLKYLNPRPTKEYIGCFYPPGFYDYRKNEEGKKTLLKKIIARMDLSRRRLGKAVIEKVRIVQRYHPLKGKLIDVGSAEGEFLQMMKTRGWAVVGVEISKDMCNYVQRRYGINCVNSSFDEFAYSLDSADAITFWASLEHLYDPNGAIQLCYQILKEGGIIVILVPNAKSLEEKVVRKIDPNPIDIPRHLFHFNAEVLEKYLRKNGFIVKAVNHFTLNGADRISVILNSYIDKIENKTKVKKIIRLILFNFSIGFGNLVSRMLSILGRSHSIVIIGEK